MRTDIHRPSAINPEEYDFVAYEQTRIMGFADCEEVMRNREIIRQHMAATGGNYSGHEHGGNCHVCGAHAIYTILFYHSKTNVYIRTGEDCADKMHMGHGDFNAFRAGVRSALEAQAGKKKCQALLDEAGIGGAWQVRLDYLAAPNGYPGDNATEAEWRAYRKAQRDQKDAATVTDILNAVIKYGDLSEKRANYLRVLLDRIARQPEIEAQRAAERDAAAPCPSGRVTINGTIVKVEERENDFGVVTKMLVKAVEGFMVWCTLPAGASSERGAEITFKATVTPSQDDPKFGFASRPRLA